VDNLIGALGQLGPIGIALVVLVVMWFLNRQTAAQYKALLSTQAEAYNARITALTDELDRKDTVHDEELGDLKTEIKALREDIRVMRAEMETERTARRVAEEEAHRLKMGGSRD